jgi:hypothetical protein
MAINKDFGVLVQWFNVANLGLMHRGTGGQWIGKMRRSIEHSMR